jgi:uncharacterized membrane protein
VSPICSRCAGIYIGFVVAGVILFIMFRKKQSELPPLYIMIILAVFFILTIVDGLASYLGFYETNNIIRFTSGTLCGAAIISVLYPVFNFQYYRKSAKERIFIRPITFIIFCLVLAAFIIFSLLRPPLLGSLYYYFSGISVILTFFFVSLTMMFLIPGFSQKADRLFTRHLIIPSVLALLLTALEIFIAYGMHRLMDRFAA